METTETLQAAIAKKAEYETEEAVTRASRIISAAIEELSGVSIKFHSFRQFITVQNESCGDKSDEKLRQSLKAIFEKGNITLPPLVVADKEMAIVNEILSFRDRIDEVFNDLNNH